MVADACQELAACGQPLEVPVQERLAAVASAFPDEADRVAAWCRLVRVYDVGGDTAAVEHGLDWIRRTASEASSSADTCWGLTAHILAELGRLAEAVEVTRHLQSDPDPWLEAVQAVITASPLGSVPEGAAEVLESIHTWVLTEATPDAKCHFLVGLAEAYGPAFTAEASMCALEAGDALRSARSNRWIVPAVARALDLYGPPSAADTLLANLAEAATREIEANPPVPGHGYVFHIRETDLAEGIIRADRTATAYQLIAALSAHERRSPLRHAAVMCARGGRWDEARVLIEEYETSSTHMSVSFAEGGEPPPPLFSPAGDSVTFDDEEGERSPRSDLALALARVGERQAAITEARQVPGNYDRVVALTGIALQDRFDGRHDASARLLAEVRSLLRVERFKPVETQARMAALSLLVEDGSVDAAIALLDRWASASADRPQLAASLVSALIARKDVEAAKPLLELLSEETRVRALIQLAALQRTVAPSLLADAARQTEALEVGITKVRLFVDVARANFAAGMADDARRYIMRAWETNNAVIEAPVRPTLWVDIFTELVRYGEADLALRAVRQIPENEAYDAAVVRCQIAEIAEVSPGDVDPVGLLEEAATLTDAVTFPPIRDGAKKVVARGFAALEMVERALAEDLAGHDRDAVTAEVAGKLAALGHLHQAQQLLEGRTDRLPRSVGTTFVHAFIKASDLDRALCTADGMEDAEHGTLLLLASALQEAGRSEDAQRVARTSWSHRASVEAAHCLVTVGLRAELTRWFQDTWLAATTPGELVEPMRLLAALLPCESDLASLIADKCEWVSSFLQTG